MFIVGDKIAGLAIITCWKVHINWWKARQTETCTHTHARTRSLNSNQSMEQSENIVVFPLFSRFLTLPVGL